MSVNSVLNLPGLGFALSVGQSFSGTDFSLLTGVPVPAASLLTGVLGTPKNGFSVGPTLADLGIGSFSPLPPGNDFLGSLFGGSSSSHSAMSSIGFMGLGSMGSLDSLLSQVYGSIGSLSGLTAVLDKFNPQSLINGATPNGAVNTPGKGGKNKSFGGMMDFLNISSGLNANNNNMLAFNQGSFVNQISGINFTAFNPSKILAQFPGLVI